MPPSQGTNVGCLVTKYKLRGVVQFFWSWVVLADAFQVAALMATGFASQLWHGLAVAPATTRARHKAAWPPVGGINATQGRFCDVYMKCLCELETGRSCVDHVVSDLKAFAMVTLSSYRWYKSTASISMFGDTFFFFFCNKPFWQK